MDLHIRTILKLGCVLLFAANLLNLSDVEGYAEDTSLHVGVLRAPASANFFGATDAWSRKILQFFHMPLYIRSFHDGEVIPWLAAAAPERGNSDREIIIRLREAHWQDGSSVTAEDLVFTVQVIQEFQVPLYYEKWQSVEKMEILDPRSVRFTLSQVGGSFFERTLHTGFVQKRHWAPIVEEIRKDGGGAEALMRLKLRKVVSNGPYVLSRYEEPFYLMLDENPQFFAKGIAVDGKAVGPFVPRILFKLFQTNAEAIRALETGKVDFLWWDLPEDRIAGMKDHLEIQVFNAPRGGYDYLGFNLGRLPYGDIAFREAVDFLVDRDHIIDCAVLGNGVPVYTVIPPANAFWNNPDIRPPNEGLSKAEQQVRAKAVLEQWGYTWRDGRLVLPDGNPMAPMEILTTCAGCKPHRFGAALLIKNALSDIGIPVSIKMQPIHDILNRLRKGDFDAYLLGWSALSTDPGYLSAFFHSQEAREFGKNYTGFCNEGFDALSQQAATETDRDRRRKLVRAMQALLARQRPYIPLYSRHRIEAVRKDRFTGWIEMPGGLGNLWTFLFLKPIENGK